MTSSQAKNLLELTSRFLIVIRMTFVGTGWGKFAQFVSDHILGYVYRNVFASVVYTKRMTNELREDRGAAGPGFDHDFLLDAFISSTFFNR